LGYRNTCYTLILEQAKKIDCLLGKAYKDGQLKDVDDSDEDTKPKAAGIFSRKRGHSRSVSVSDTNSPMGSPATRKADSAADDSDDGSHLKPGPGKVVPKSPIVAKTSPAQSPALKRMSARFSRDTSGSTETESETETTEAESESETEEEGEKDGAKAAEKQRRKELREQKKKERREKREARKAKKEEAKKEKDDKKQKRGSVTIEVSTSFHHPFPYHLLIFPPPPPLSQQQKKEEEHKAKNQDKQATRTDKIRHRFGLGENSRFIDSM